VKGLWSDCKGHNLVGFGYKRQNFRRRRRLG
jgi:hypothetical protein